MSEFGLRILNIQAGSLYGVNLGIRDMLDSTDAMLTHSLFTNYMLKHGLNVWKGESTRDIICLQFDYGCRGYEQEVAYLMKSMKDLEDPKKVFKKYGKSLSEKEINEKMATFSKFLLKADENKELFKKISKEKIRSEYYENGVDITYHTHDRKGAVINTQTIHYKMLYRTPGKAKKGSCMFINADLYDTAIDYLRMGIKLPEGTAPIIEIGAYASLSTSTIVGSIKIDPHDVVVLNDVKSAFKTKVVSIEMEGEHCVAKRYDNYEVSNELFDGQALIDESIFPAWASGYVLLREHFCKAAAFCTKMQKYFHEYYGDDYETAEIEDIFGVKHKVKDIKIITTTNAMKWLKFDVSYEDWCQRVTQDNENEFGIVKTCHPSKLGEVQRMSYQMINALEIDTMSEVMQTTVDYIEQLKTNDEVFLEYLKLNQNFSNDFEALLALVEWNPDFIYSEYFRERKQKIIETYVLNFKTGKVIQNADNLVIVGNPYGMLMHAVGLNAEDDPTFNTEDDAIQCWTSRFENGEYLAGFRSPFNSRNNIDYLHNVYSDEMDKYFIFAAEIIAVNMVNTDFQDRNNGSDQDSDSLYVTNNAAVVASAKKSYNSYPTIVNNIPKQTNHYHNTLKEFAKVDNNLAAAQLAIGESSNLAQLALTYTYNLDDDKFDDYVCILSVLAQCAIDNAKRAYAVNLVKEIPYIKSQMDIKENGYPSFWLNIRPGFKKKKVNTSLECPMNCIYDYKIKEFHSNIPTIPMHEFFVKWTSDGFSRYKSKAVEALIEKYSLELYMSRINESDTRHDNYLLLRNDFEQMIDDINKVYISRNYQDLMSWLIDRAFVITSDAKRHKNQSESRLNKNKSLLFATLYRINPDVFLKCFRKNFFRLEETE